MLSQRVLIKVHKSIGKFDLDRPNRMFRAWLREITKNVICDFIREEKRRRKTISLTDRSSLIENAIQIEFPEPNEDDEKSILMHRILELIHPEFDEKHWEIFFLFINAGQTSTEVAKAMNMKPDTVRKIKNRILKRIREACREFGLEELFMNINGD
ncbi:MAG: sigma-70 family RNA polymerase sigma factor [Planctomycetia bacterium]|nr:sigma-70 family RNA polymerase sigma factor [Planctomycetia bacterium]